MITHKMPYVDITGQRFGRLLVLKRVDSNGRGARFLCVCDCGTEKEADSKYLRNGLVASCGCLAREKFVDNLTSHGMSRTKAYKRWRGIIDRCTNPKKRGYKNYGGRGIAVCDEWLNSFEQYYADMGEPPSESHSIDRINNDGNYEPSNCRWATASEQAKNKRKRQPLPTPKDNQ